MAKVSNSAQLDMFSDVQPLARNAVVDRKIEIVPAVIKSASPGPLASTKASSAGPQPEVDNFLKMQVGAASVIEDAGAELTYNRRNRDKKEKTWEDVSLLNDALKAKESTKDNIWNKPDYELMIAGGMEPVIAYLVKSVYDSISSKPRIGNNKIANDDVFIKYFSAIENVRDKVLAWASDSIKTKDFLKRLHYVDGMHFSPSFSFSSNIQNDILDIVYPATEVNVRSRLSKYSNEISIIGGNKLSGSLQISNDDIKKAVDEIKKGWPGKKELWQTRGYVILSSENISIDKFNKDSKYIVSIGKYNLGFYENQEDANARKESFLPNILFDKNKTLIGSFSTKEAAIEHARSLVKVDRKESIDDKGISVLEAKRKGPERRLNNEDISSDRLMSEFGLKGINFGNWMKTPSARAEAQLHLNHAFDSLHDLAQVLGVPPKAIGLGGMLGIAVGAQGRGGSAAAHFVPGVNEINLTRTSGAGSLAHEYAHALDHYFAVQAGFSTKQRPFLTEEAYGKLTKKIKIGTDQSEMYAFGNARESVVLAFKKIVTAMERRTESVDEAISRQNATFEKSEKNLNAWLSQFRNQISKDADDDKKDVINKKFDLIEAKFKNMDLGVYDENTLPYRLKGYSLPPAFFEIKNMFLDYRHSRPVESDMIGLNASYLNFAACQQTKESKKVPEQYSVNTLYKIDALKLDEGKSKDYYSTKLEMFARAFDVFVSDKLLESGIENSYLSHVGKIGPTVPHGDERKDINREINNLALTLKTMDNEKGVGLFSIAKEKPISGGMDIDEISLEVDRIRKSWRRMPEVEIVRNVDDLPVPANKLEVGLYNEGKIWLVAENLHGNSHLQKVLAHECVMHHTVLEMLGKEGFESIHRGIQAMAFAGNNEFTSLSKEVRSTHGNLTPREQSAEIIALAGERCVGEDGEINVKFGFMKSVFASFSGWLRTKGFDVPLTITELQGVIHKAGERIKSDVEYSVVENKAEESQELSVDSKRQQRRLSP